MNVPLQIKGDASYEPRVYDGIRPYLKEGETLSHLVPKCVTTAIGDDFEQKVDLASLLPRTLENDAILRDLAIRVSERGVCFFRNQSLDFQGQEEIVVRMAHLTGSPTTSTCHVHPISQQAGSKRLELSEKRIDEQGTILFPNLFSNQYWHVDCTFEPVGPAYSCLKIHTSPNGGGDTLWCSLFDCVDKLSPSFVAYLETLTAEHDASWYHAIAAHLKASVATNRGSAENSDPSLKAIQPVITTHPVTGWKYLNVNRAYTKYINGMTAQESDVLLEYLYKIISDNHDIQVRNRWDNNDVALWDNRSVAHNVTNDYGGKARLGTRTLSIGEKTVINQKSLTKRQALLEQASQGHRENGNGVSNGNGNGDSNSDNGVNENGAPIHR
ncbi:hypothetical protein CBS101457_002434 [Exobasidium rhododendri]|nr:hypothetical protein CBS101457_002434 [Exobasidium rhododendri]